MAYGFVPGIMSATIQILEIQAHLMEKMLGFPIPQMDHLEKVSATTHFPSSSLLRIFHVYIYS